MTLNDMMALSVAVGSLILGAGHADAQSACGPHEKIIAQLGNSYGETRQSLGLATDGSVLEIFASETGSWTIIVTDANGRTCLAAAGEAWQDAPVTVTGQPA